MSAQVGSKQVSFGTCARNGILLGAKIEFHPQSIVYCSGRKITKDRQQGVRYMTQSRMVHWKSSVSITSEGDREITIFMSFLFL
jgi:hypothetical protein